MSSKFITEMVGLINKLREDPEAFVPILEKYMGYIDDKKVMRIPGADAGIQLNEGREAYVTAINEIRNLPKGTPALELNEALRNACKEYCGMLSKADDPNSVEKFGENVCGKYGDFVGSLSNLSEFGGNNPEQIITNLLAQDGSPNKTYMKALTSSKFKVIGAHFATHDVYQYCTFIALATKYNAK